MKFLLLIFTYILSILSLQAQEKHRVDYRVETNLKFDDVDGTAVLIFDHNESIYKYIDLPQKGYSVDNGTNSSVWKDGYPDGLPIYCNRVENLVESKYFAVTKRNACIISDTVPKINWKIIEEFKQIKTLNCQKATGLFGGRVYDVWFTQDIPVSLGPHKLNGLPGLIIEAKSRDEVISFVFQSFQTKVTDDISRLSDTFDIPLYTHQKYKKVKKKIEKNIKIEMESEPGVTWEPIDEKIDWQIEKRYF